MKWKKIKEWIDNTTGDEGAKALSESLKINTSLTQLVLAGKVTKRSEEMKRMKMENE